MNTLPFRLLLSLTLVTACAPEEDVGPAETRMSVTKRLEFAVQTDGVSSGFDLDAHVSSRGTMEGCRRDDFVSPEGAEGIDNQFTFIYDAIRSLFGDAVDGLLQGVINDGSLLIFVELDDVNDSQNDDDIRVSIFSGAGTPDLGTDGFIAPSQTFDVKDDSPFSSVRGRIENGVMTAGPFDAEIPVQIFQVFFNLRVRNAMLRGTVTEDGLSSVILGGGIENTQLLEIAEQADAEQETQTRDLLEVTLRGLTDLVPDERGRCTQTSATMIMDMVPAYLYADTVRPAGEADGI